MSLYVLDTDHLTLYHHDHPVVAPRVDGTPPEDLAISIITVEEQLTGWYTQLRKARDADQLAKAYEGMFEALQLIKELNVLPFTLSAARRLFDLRKQLPRLGKMDLAIAATVLDHGGILVTRNRSDFQQVPGLLIEDWSR